MAGDVVGQIAFELNLDSDELSSGLRNLTKSSNDAAKKMKKSFLDSAANIKAAFDMAIGSIKSMMSACSQMMSAYQTQIEAEARLAATMRNATSASDAQIQSVKELASSLQELGVVGDEVQLAGAQELATYVSSTESIKTMLPVLDDMIAQQYGFSASTDSAVTIATMLGKVLQGQTSALSRYGYSFDEAQEKLLKYGTEEERVATLASVVEESVSGVNKSLADTPTGKIKQLSNDFGDLKETLGKFVTDIIYPFVKQLDVIIKKLNEVFTTASKGIKELLGIQDNANTGSAMVGFVDDVESGVADIVEDTQDRIQDSIDDTVKALQKAQGQLAGYDNLNVLSQPESDDEDSGTEELPVTADEVAAVSDSIDSLQDSIDSVNCSVFDKLANKVKEALSVLEPVATAVKNNIQTTVDTAQKGIEKYLDKYGSRISEYSDRISAHLQNTATQTSNGVANIINEATASQERMSEELSDGYADLLGGASICSLSFAEVFADGLDIASGNFEDWTVKNKELIGGFFDDCNKTAANGMTTFGGIFESIGTTLTEWWKNTGCEVFDNLTKAFFDVQTALLELWSVYIQPIIDNVIENVGKLWDDHLQPLWENLLYLFSSVSDCISAIWNNILRPIVDWIINSLGPGISVITTTIVDIVTDCIGWIVDLISGLIKVLQGIIDFITGIFTGDLEKVFEGIDEMFEGLAMMIINTLKFMINTIIDGLNLLWGAIYTVVKGIVDVVGKITGAFGDLFGQDWHFSMPDEVPRIPRLAKGGLVTAPTLAIVGDNKNAKNDPEVVSPLSKLQGMIDSSSADNTEILQQILMYLKMLYEFYKNGGGDVNVIAELDGDVVFKDMIRRDKAHERRHGKGAFAR